MRFSVAGETACPVSREAHRGYRGRPGSNYGRTVKGAPRRRCLRRCGVRAQRAAAAPVLSERLSPEVRPRYAELTKQAGEALIRLTFGENAGETAETSGREPLPAAKSSGGDPTSFFKSLGGNCATLKLQEGAALRGAGKDPPSALRPAVGTDPISRGLRHVSAFEPAVFFGR